MLAATVLTWGTIVVAGEAPEKVNDSLATQSVAGADVSGEARAEESPPNSKLTGAPDQGQRPLAAGVGIDEPVTDGSGQGEQAVATDVGIDEPGIAGSGQEGQDLAADVGIDEPVTDGSGQEGQAVATDVGIDDPVTDGLLSQGPQALATSVASTNRAIDGLSRGQQELSTRVARNGEAIDSLDREQQAAAVDVGKNAKSISTLGEKLDGAIDRSVSTSMRVDTLGANLRQTEDVVDSHRDRIETNSVGIFEAGIEMDAVQEEQKQIRKALVLTENAAADEDATLAALSARGAELRLLLTVALCLLVPLAALVFRGDVGGLHSASGTGTPAATADVGLPETTAWMVMAWFGGGAGYFLVGAGIMFGATLAGFVGAPTDFISELWTSNPGQLDSAIVSLVISHTLLAGIVSVIVCSASAERLSRWGHLLVALAVGVLIYPLLGHWTNASALLTSQSGWLSSAGFIYSSGTTGVALLGGVMALSLASGLRRKDSETNHLPAHRGSLRTETAGAVLLWVAWPGVVLAAGVGDLQLPALLLVVAITSAAGALSVLAFESLFLAEPQRRRRIAGAAFAGLVAAPGAYASASTAELLLLGALAGLSYQLLMRILGRGPTTSIELAAMLTAGGLWGTLAPVLFGTDGLLSLWSFTVVLPQLLGLGVALALAVAAGRALALPLVRIEQLRVPS